MPVTITLTHLSQAVGVTVQGGPVEPQLSILQGLLDAATELVNAYASEAPDSVANEAVIRLAGYLLDSEPANPSRNVSTPESAFRNSGAKPLLSGYHSIATAVVR